MQEPSEATTTSRSAQPTADAVREELQRLLASCCFAGAPSLRRLVSHLVDKTLEGRPDDLKEYALGVDVFDRGPSFDTRLDTIVRVQARRLRLKLREYYDTEGRNDPLRIELAKGAYIPQFSVQGIADSSTAQFVSTSSINGSVSPQLARAPRSRAVFAALGLLLMATAGLAIMLFVRQSTSRPTSGPVYTQLTDFTDSVVAPSLSPDGRMVTFIRGGDGFLKGGPAVQVYVKSLPRGDAIRLTNTSDAKFGPVFTPDGSRVSYTRVVGPQWDTWLVPITGGEPTRMLPNASALVWLDQDHVLFSEFKPPVPHLGIVTATPSRAARREVYFPPHERAMAHFSSPSPDRKWALVIEMDPTGLFGPCRLVPLRGDAASPRQIGPAGKCTAAGWSPDGEMMYFTAEVAGHSHIWRQRLAGGEPEQVTFGPTEEDGIAVEADGRSLITSVGQRQSAIWIHDNTGDRPITTEGFAFGPRLSHDGRKIFYLVRQSVDSEALELRSIELESRKVERPLPGIAIADTPFGDYDISPDGRHVVYVTKSAAGRSNIWLAPLDRSTPPTQLAQNGALVSVGPHDDVFFVQLEEKTSYFAHVRLDGTPLQRVGRYAPIINRSGVSPDGKWAVLFTAENGTPTGTIAMPIDGGTSRRLCTNLCWAWWSKDAKAFFVTTMRSRTFVMPLAKGHMFPELPQSGFDTAQLRSLPPGARVIDEVEARPGSEASTYVYVRSNVQRNLYRIPLDDD
jgi:Tol biopolymer transport system component